MVEFLGVLCLNAQFLSIVGFSMNQALIFGEVLFDCFPDGKNVLGGAPFNVAWNLKGLGMSPLMISCIGRDENAEIVLDAMDKWGLSTEGIQQDSQHPTGLVSISMDGTSHAFQIEDEQAYDFIEFSEIPESAATPGVKLLYYGTLALRSEVSRRAFMKLAEVCSAPCFMDLNLRKPWWSRNDFPALFKLANWVKLNDEELEIVLEQELRTSFDSMINAAVSLRRRYDLEALVVTCGEKGAFLVDASDTVVRSPDTEVENFIDTVGAGDAFASVVIAGILNEWDWENTLQRAVKFAAAVVGIRGAVSTNSAFYHKQLAAWE